MITNQLLWLFVDKHLELYIIDIMRLTEISEDVRGHSKTQKDSFGCSFAPKIAPNKNRIETCRAQHHENPKIYPEGPDQEDIYLG